MKAQCMVVLADCIPCGLASLLELTSDRLFIAMMTGNVLYWTTATESAAVCRDRSTLLYKLLLHSFEESNHFMNA
jgi:hypothetical protein